MKKLVVIVLVVLVSSCKTKQKLVEQSKVETKDTLIVKNSSVIQAPILSELIIEEVCDSTTNKPKQLKQTIAVGKDTVYVEVDGNNLKLRVHSLEKTLSKKDSIIQKQRKLISELKDTKETKVVWSKWTYIFLLWGIVATALHFVRITL